MLMLRQADESDIPALDALIVRMGFHYESGYFNRCLQEQAGGKRLIFIATQDNTIVGVAQLIFSPVYAPFRAQGIPEIQDLNVIPDARQQGIGSRLVERCEEEARARGLAEIGIGVGLYARYGAAQRLYVRRGYVPDGRGAVYDEEPVSYGQMRLIDEWLALKMTKKLS